MKRWTKVGVMAAGGIAVAAAGAVSVGVLSWSRATKRAVRRLTRLPPRAAGDDTPRTDDLAALPAPVARYFAFALPAGHPRIVAARAAWAGTFLTKRGAKRSPFIADQHFDVDPPGFVWDAKIRMLPVVPVRVRDSYLEGNGAMVARAAGIVPVVDQHGTPELAEAALQRYLGEAVWFPTALLPSAGVQWTAIDDTTARATLTDHGNTASVDFHFRASGEISACTTMRQRDVDGTPVLTPWRARTWDYAPVDGIMVPRSGEAEWVLPDGPLTYWRGRITRISYEYAAPEAAAHVGAR